MELRLQLLLLLLLLMLLLLLLMVLLMPLLLMLLAMELDLLLTLPGLLPLVLPLLSLVSLPPAMLLHRHLLLDLPSLLERLMLVPRLSIRYKMQDFNPKDIKREV